MTFLIKPISNRRQFSQLIEDESCGAATAQFQKFSSVIDCHFKIRRSHDQYTKNSG